MMKLLAILLGFIPYGLGGLMDWYMLSNINSIPPFKLIAFAVLLLWAVFAYVLRFRLTTKETVLFLNIIPAVDLILVAVQELIVGAYWPNIIGAMTQLYYLPLLNLSFSLTFWAGTTFLAYCSAFLLMCIVAFLGCELHKKS